MTETDYTQGVPTTPPEELLEYMRAKGFFDEHRLVYRAAWMTDPLTGIKEKCVEVRCTACKDMFHEAHVPGECGCAAYSSPAFGFHNSLTTENIKSGSITMCPQCGAGVRAMHIRELQIPAPIVQTHPLTVQVINGRLTLLCWYVKKLVFKNGETAIESMPYEGYILDGRKMIRMSGYQRFMGNYSFFGYWKARKRGDDSYGKADLVLPWDPEILKVTDAENSKLDVYMKKEGSNAKPVSYLKVWQRHKNIENLVVQGACTLVTELFEEPEGGTVRWKEKRPAQMLGLSKEEFAVMKADKWSLKELKFFQEKRDAYKLRADDVKDIIREGIYFVERIEKTGESVMKVIRYLRKQRRKYKTMDNTIDISHLLDYWSMAKKAGDNLENIDVRYPQNLVSAHDAAMERQMFEKNKELIPLFEKRLAELSVFSWQSEELGLLIRPAETAMELHKEGEILHHCVGNYAKRHAEGNTSLFFIRRTEAPEVPFFTLEIDIKNKTVRQNRGLRNCGETDEVKAFKEQWLTHIKQITKRRKKNNESGACTRKSA